MNIVLFMHTAGSFGYKEKVLTDKECKFMRLRIDWIVFVGDSVTGTVRQGCLTNLLRFERINYR